MNSEDLIQQLRDENAALREENAALRQRVVAQQEQLGQLQQGLAAAEERLQELEQRKKGSPSFVKPNKAKREGDKPPRQRRTVEHNHGRKRAEVVTHHEEHHLERCPRCAGKLRKERVAWRREVIDLPPPPAVEVTEHVVYKGYCPRCEGWQSAAVGAGAVVGHRRFGKRLMALIGYLSESLRLPHAVIQSYLQTMHGIEVSAGAIADLRRGLAEQLRPLAERWQAELRRSPIVHADETGWREEGQNGYIWAFSTPGAQGVRYYHYDHSRGGQVVEGILGEEFRGVLGSDFYGAYNVHRGPHQRCWSHLLDDLHLLKEEHPVDDAVQHWAQAVRALYDRAQAFLKGEPPPQPERERLYVVLWEEAERLGLRYAQAEHPCRALAKRLLRHQDELFTFVLVAGLAADNNLAERSLRPLVVVRKISGGSRSPQGSRIRMTLASVFATLKARGLNPFNECLALLMANS
jgi:transposase